VPIPGEWFDADYFEHGLKSNWTKGYHWRDFAGLFRQTAEFLAAMLPEAGSFLDAGCAKGFLVRSLRERHKEAWGFDHSHWAIEHAEELARPFLLCKSAESAAFDRLFDVTLAFSLLENLTEDQAVQFLQRARAWTSQAIVAVVLTCDDESERGRLLADDHDLAHLTLQSRAWWHDRIASSLAARVSIPSVAGKDGLEDIHLRPMITRPSFARPGATPAEADRLQLDR
jgi:SAM-dependent methyltransferase